MCEWCGCSTPENPDGHGAHEHAHGHHGSSHTHESPHRALELGEAILAENQRHAGEFVEEAVSMVQSTVIEELLSMVTQKDNQGVVVQPSLRKPFEQAPNCGIRVCYLAVIERDDVIDIGR